MRYRIVEHWEKFYIQVWGIKRSRQCSHALWGKDKIVEKEDWCGCSCYGRPVLKLFSMGGWDEPCIKPFDTLEEANNQIRIWQTPDKIHEV